MDFDELCLNSVLKLLLEFVALQVEHYIIRYQCDDANEGRKAFTDAKAEADE